MRLIFELKALSSLVLEESVLMWFRRKYWGSSVSLILLIFLESLLCVVLLSRTVNMEERLFSLRLKLACDSYILFYDLYKIILSASYLWSTSIDLLYCKAYLVFCLLMADLFFVFYFYFFLFFLDKLLPFLASSLDFDLFFYFAEFFPEVFRSVFYSSTFG